MKIPQGYFRYTVRPQQDRCRSYWKLTVLTLISILHEMSL